MINKAIMAAAVAGALAAPGLALAQASTAGTNVQIYGLFDVRWDWMTVTQGTASTSPSQINRKSHLSTGAPNRIGFRGTEDLGAGMQAFFQVETQVFTDARQDVGAQQQTNATLGGRPTFVGLRGGWGELSAGYQESVYKDVYITSWSVVPTQPHFGVIMGNGNASGSVPTPSCTGTFANGTNNFQGVSTTANPTVGGVTVAPVLTPPATTAATTVAASVICTEAPGNTTSFNRTVSDSVTYRTPVIAGFRFSTMLTAQEFKEPSSATPTGGNTLNPNLGAYSLTWAAGPLALAAAYERHNGFRAVNNIGIGANRAARDNGLSLGGRFNYGAGLLGIGYERLKYGNSGGVVAGDNGFEIKNWIVNGTFNLTPSDTLGAGYSKTPGKSNCGAAVVCGGDTGAKLLSVSIDHAFSKRTAVYAYWSKLDNNGAANYNYISDSRTTNQAAGAGAGYALGSDSKNFNLGVKHTF